MKKLSKRFIEAMENAVDQLAVGLDEDQKKKNVAISIRQFEIAANKGWENSKCGLYIEPLEKTGDIHPKGYYFDVDTGGGKTVRCCATFQEFEEVNEPRRKLKSHFIKALGDFIETACAAFDPLERKQVLNSLIKKLEDTANHRSHCAECRMCIARSANSELLDCFYYVVSFKTDGGGTAEVGSSMEHDFERVAESVNEQ